MHGYLNWSHALLRKAVIGVVIIVGFTLADAFMGRTLPTSFLPEEDYGYAMLHVQLPPAASLERTDEVLKKVEQILGHTEGVQLLHRHWWLQFAESHLGELPGLFLHELQAVG